MSCDGVFIIVDFIVVLLIQVYELHRGALVGVIFSTSHAAISVFFNGCKAGHFFSGTYFILQDPGPKGQKCRTGQVSVGPPVRGSGSFKLLGLNFHQFGVIRACCCIWAGSSSP